MTPEDAYRAQFDASPELAADPRRAAVMRDLVFPGRTEAWRYTPTRALLAEVRAPGAPALAALPEGVTGFGDTPAHVLEHVGRVARSDGFLGLNLAFCREIAVIHVGAGIARGPIALRLTHDGLSTPRVLVVAEAGASVELEVDQVVGSGMGLPVTEIVAGDGASVSLTQVVSGPLELVGHVAVDAGTGARVAVHTVVTGSQGTARLELDGRIGAGARIDVGSLVLGRGTLHVDQHLHLVHAGHGGTSTQRVRNVMGGRARAVFTGQVDVSPGVTGSDADQSVSSLLLTDGASAVTRPWLEIHNDQVKAAHGATVGRLDPEALFYLQARGIGRRDAVRLLVRAAAGEVVDAMPEAFRAGVQARVDAWLAEESS